MKEIDRLFEEKIMKGDIEIWGGEIAEEYLREFVMLWDISEMPFTILETLREIRIIRDFDYSEIDSYTVDRIRIFGESGDLDIRRNSNIFLWRYLGRSDLPEGIEGKNFWDENPDKEFFLENNEYALLWGKYDPEKKLWCEDRVAGHKLSYPISGNPERVKIRYKTLSENGILAFVWVLTIEGGKQDE